MKDGVQSITIFPSTKGRISVAKEIFDLFHDANQFRAAIAFWTLSIDKLKNIAGINPISVMKKPGSFLCCDLQWPTNIDNLAEFVQAGVDVYLNLRRLSPTHAKFSHSSGLLHSKMILTDKVAGPAELWIGSHNWTDYALQGPNTETSLAIKIDQNAPLYLEAETFLNEVKNGICSRLDLTKVRYYKDLQKKLFEREKRRSNVIELEGHNIYSLSGEVINIFGENRDDYESLNEVGRDIYVSLYDTTKPGDPNATALYKAHILQSGVLDKMNPAARGIEINAKRRYAFDNRIQFPVLEPAKQITPKVLNDALFFVTIEIERIFSNKYAIEPPDAKIYLWSPAINDPSLEKMDISQYDIEDYEDSMIWVPIDDEKAHPKFKYELKKEYEMRMSLYEKRELKPERKSGIVSKMIIREK